MFIHETAESQKENIKNKRNDSDMTLLQRVQIDNATQVCITENPVIKHGLDDSVQTEWPLSQGTQINSEIFKLNAHKETDDKRTQADFPRSLDTQVNSEILLAEMRKNSVFKHSQDESVQVNWPVNNSTQVNFDLAKQLAMQTHKESVQVNWPKNESRQVSFSSFNVDSQLSQVAFGLPTNVRQEKDYCANAGPSGFYTFYILFCIFLSFQNLNFYFLR